MEIVGVGVLEEENDVEPVTEELELLLAEEVALDEGVAAALNGGVELELELALEGLGKLGGEKEVLPGVLEALGVAVDVPLEEGLPVTVVLISEESGEGEGVKEGGALTGKLGMQI